MPDDSPAEVKRDDAPLLVSIPEMPPQLAASGLTELTASRIRQLLADEPDFPKPVYERGRVRLWLWADIERYFRNRKLRQGERTDLKAKSASDAPGAKGA